MENKNKKEDLNKICEKINEYLKRIESAPGIAFHEVPQSFYPDMETEEGNFKKFHIFLRA